MIVKLRQEIKDEAKLIRVEEDERRKRERPTSS